MDYYVLGIHEGIMGDIDTGCSTVWYDGSAFYDVPYHNNHNIFFYGHNENRQTWLRPLIPHD